MTIASLAMYAAPAPVAEANDSFWTFLRDGLRAAGMANAPQTLSHDLAYDASWERSDLLFAQTCGYPYVTRLRGRVRLVATPCYAYPGCDGPFTGSFVVVRADSDFDGLAALAGSRVAVNGLDSNSGMNLLRRSVAPLARSGRFFGSKILTGGHRASLKALREHAADVAAIDCVTFGHIARFAPEETAGLSILASTPIGPGLPFITRGDATDDEVETLRSVLRAAIAEPSLEPVRNTLALKDIVVLTDTDYERLAEYRREAEALGYPLLD